MTVVIKRDGRQVMFDKTKIVNALLKAYNSIYKEPNSDFTEYANGIADYILQKAEKTKEPLEIEDVQNIIEQKLMSGKYKTVAKEYILYREKETKKEIKEVNKLSQLKKE